MTHFFVNCFLFGVFLALLIYAFTGGYLYWPLFDVLLASPETKGFLVGVALVAFVVSTCVFLCAVGTLAFLRGARR